MIHLNEMIEDVLGEFSALAQRKNLSLSTHGGKADMEGYPVLIREMLYNLIDNAVKYTPEGGKIDVTLEEKVGGIRVSVADNGIGIPKEHQGHVFERFYRVDKSHSRATGGTGLGLAIVKHAAEIHHAGIELTSEMGQGTTITVYFKKANN